jgi:hypothetical protein
MGVVAAGCEDADRAAVPAGAGIRIIYEPDGSLLVQPARFRHPDGHWLPAVVLAPELASAIAAEVLEAFRDTPNQ